MQSVDSLWWIFIIDFVVVLIITFIAIPIAAKKFKEAKLTGKNLNSINEEEIPESLGLIVGMIFILSTVILSFIITPLIGLVYTMLMTSILALLLGFIDDILGIRWRYKIFIPLIAAIPLILNFTGSTSIELPFFGVVELGLTYTLIIIPLITVYMANSINIHAGVNSLEVGQVLVLSGVILIVGVMTNNTFAVYMVVPLIATTIALSYYNKYPAKVFVGNSFTYFAGMALIAIAILANMERIVILCTFPQLINFVYSLKDFFGETPRHRKPVYNKETGLMEDSGSHTLLNLILKKTGPISERKLAGYAIAIQVINAAIVLVVWSLFFIL
ncbi:MAG: UDP-N-acetylglucosamine--dolichyl-phosphate N-acetylglucosaminephosphotransferase [Candidatus Odinarchaeia archaeon]